MTLASRSLVGCTALAIILASQSSIAAPKHDKGNPHHNDQGSDVRIDLNGPTVDIGRVRIVLGDNRNLIGNASALPPGIQKNLARGKPLPPGIAKKFDNRLIGKLPHYDGYEWKQAGTDVVLVAIATGIVYEVLRNVLD